MSTCFRICPARYARDLSGEGARLSGGRWNAKNTPLIYASENRSLAALEYLIHVSLSNMPPKIAIISLHVPDSIVPRQLDAQRLPKDWRMSPAPYALAKMGTAWANAKESLLFRVPSAVVPDECNILINPLHPDVKFLRIADIQDFTYDERLLKRT
ncbi:MAG: RES family NAD+ phosphorylase [Nitrospirota bacterium]